MSRFCGVALKRRKLTRLFTHFKLLKLKGLLLSKYVFRFRPKLGSINRGYISQMYSHRLSNLWINIHKSSSLWFIHSQWCYTILRSTWRLVSSQVIQSYGTSLSSYGWLFSFSHFTWVLSLIFLYSGRGYWQELIESVIFSHHKLGIITAKGSEYISGQICGLDSFRIGRFRLHLYLPTNLVYYTIIAFILIKS